MQYPLHPDHMTCNSDMFFVFNKKQQPIHTSHVVLNAARQRNEPHGNLNNVQMHLLANTSTTVQCLPRSRLHPAEVCKVSTLVGAGYATTINSETEKKLAEAIAKGTAKPRSRSDSKLIPTSESDIYIEEYKTPFRFEQLPSAVVVEVILRLARACDSMVPTTGLHGTHDSRLHTVEPRTYHRPIRGHPLNRGCGYAYCVCTPQ